MPTLELPKVLFMQKTITRTGPNGTFTGKVEILFNQKAKDNERPIKNVPVPLNFFHIIRGNAEQLSWLSDEFANKDDAVYFAKKMEIKVISELEMMAHQTLPKSDSVEQSLKNLGYV